MNTHASPPVAVATRPRLYGIVQTYMQRQLPRDIHPAFKALRDREEAAITSPQIAVTEDTSLPLQVEQGSRLDQIRAVRHDDDYDDDDLPLYVTSQGPSFSMADAAK